MKNWGIRARVLFLALVPLTVMVLSMSAYFVVTRLHDLDRALQNRGQAIARGLAPACEYGVVSGNRSILSNLAQSGLTEADVISGTIADMHGNILARAAATGHQEDDDVRKFQAPVHQSAIVFDDWQNRVETRHPAVLQARRQVGWVAVELSTASTQAQQARILANGLVIIVIGLGLTAVFAQRMARGVISPIQALTDTVERIRNGDFTTPVPQQSGGELGRLETGINVMAEALTAAREKEKRRAEDALYLEKVRAQVTLESIGDGVITTDAEAHIVYMNSVAEQFTGWNRDSARGHSLDEVFRLCDEATDAPD